MLTGFHGFHVFVGAIMLTVVLARLIKGHFTPEHHFAFEGAAWYWHFVDVVWLRPLHGRLLVVGHARFRPERTGCDRPRTEESHPAEFPRQIERTHWWGYAQVRACCRRTRRRIADATGNARLPLTRRIVLCYTVLVGATLCPV